MEIRKVNVSLLNPAAYNPRKDLQPEDAEYQTLKKSMDEYGYIDPIVWNERTGNVVHGHQRLKILIENGEQEIEVSVVNLDDMREKSLNLALNKISGEWDNEKLSAVLMDISECNLLDYTGFSAVDINELFNAATTYSYIDDLVQESFASLPGAIEKETFEVTLTFEIQHKQNINTFIKEKGRKALVDIILVYIAESGDQCA